MSTARKFDPSLPVTGYIRQLYADRFDPACRPRYLRLIIHPTAAHLRASALRYHPHMGGGFFDHTLGVFQQVPLATRYDRRQRKWVDTTGSFAGIIRVEYHSVNPMIVAHECAHAALHITRLHDWSKDDHGGEVHLDDMQSQEEPFCHLLGDLVATAQTMVAEALDSYLDSD